MLISPVSPHSLTGVRTCTGTWTATHYSVHLTGASYERRGPQLIRPVAGRLETPTLSTRLTLPYALFDNFLVAPRAAPLLRCYPPAHDFPSKTKPLLAVLHGSCGHELAVRRPAALFRALDSALMEFLLLLEPQYGPARATGSY